MTLPFDWASWDVVRYCWPFIEKCGDAGGWFGGFGGIAAAATAVCLFRAQRNADKADRAEELRLQATERLAAEARVARLFHMEAVDCFIQAEAVIAILQTRAITDVADFLMRASFAPLARMESLRPHLLILEKDCATYVTGLISQVARTESALDSHLATARDRTAILPPVWGGRFAELTSQMERVQYAASLAIMALAQRFPELLDNYAQQAQSYVGRTHARDDANAQRSAETPGN